MKALQALIGAASAALLLMAPVTAEPATEKSTTEQTRAVILSLYEGFKTGDGAKISNAMSPEIEWNEAEGNPYADGNPYIGLTNISKGVFARLGAEWENWTTTPTEFLFVGYGGVVFGGYTPNNNATGKPLDTPFIHSYRVVDGKAVSFQQYTDTAAQIFAMTPEE
ncbi:MAG: nuclear transport factor 2 family protein [Pseudomonadota bacterium]